MPLRNGYTRMVVKHFQMPVSISVVIPVFNASQHLSVCLEHLLQCRPKPLECIVVDDGSTDGSADVAKKYGAAVVATGGRLGPAYARNLGARAAHGDILFFLDSDVRVHPETLARITALFEGDPELAGVSGSYDDSPGSPDFISQYRNLMHHYVHQHARREACTFFSACGAVRREVFFRHGGFDQAYGRPAIEDIELGYRMAESGCKIILDHELQVTHLKRWTFWRLMKTDIFDRGIPWTELILQYRRMPNDLNVRFAQRVSVALSLLGSAIAGAAAVWLGGNFVAPLTALLLFGVGQCWVERDPEGNGRFAIALMTCWSLGAIALARYCGMPYICLLVGLGYAVAIGHRCSAANARLWTRRLAKIYATMAMLVIVFHFPGHPFVLALFGILLVVLAINEPFYMFLSKERGRFFALTAVPFHLLYQLYSGTSFLS